MSELRQQIAATLIRVAEDILNGAPLETFEWLAVTPDDSEFHMSEHAQATAEEWCEEPPSSYDEWPEHMEHVSWGLYVPIERAVQCDREETPEGPHDYTCNYELRATVVQSDRLVDMRGDDIPAPLPGASVDLLGHFKPIEDIGNVTWAEVDPDDPKLAAITKGIDAFASPELKSITEPTRHCTRCWGTGKLTDGGTCVNCDGSGKHIERIMCPRCDGTGEIVDGNHSGHAGVAIWVCPRCDGTRRVVA